MTDNNESKNPFRSSAVVVAIISGIVGLLTIVITGAIGQNNAAFQTSLQLTSQAAQSIDTATWTARQISINTTASFVPIAILSPTFSLTTPTNIATQNTNSPTLSATEQNVTSTLLPPNLQTTIRQYPCEGTITANGSDASLLQIGFTQPPPGGIAIDPIRVGKQVSIIDKRNTPSNGIWLRIAEINGTRLGWVPSANVAQSSSCPS